MADEVRPIDAELLTTNIAQIAKNCAISDAQKALIGRILFMIENMPTIEVEPAQSVHQGTWLFNTHTEVSPWKCSKCNYDTVARFNYCPSCGTIMGGDNNG